MSILKLILTKKRESSSTELVKVDNKNKVLSKIDTSNRLVVIKGKKYFDILEDGNGRFRAKHVDGKYLWNTDHLFNGFENATKYNTLEECQAAAMRYVKGQQTNLVGTIEFIPNK